MSALRDTRTAGQRRADEYNWGQPKHQPLQQVNVPNPGEPTRQLVALKILGYLLFLIGCCLLAMFWDSGMVQGFLAVVRAQP